MAESRFTFESDSLEKSIKYASSLQLSRKSGLSLSRVSLDSTLSDASTNEIASALRAEQDEMQKKAFTRWCNIHLVGRDKIRDLYVDFRDGVLLIKFLRSLSGKEFAKPEKGKMRIHALQNLQACVRFLIKNDVFLDKVCTGAEDIAAGTPSNTLGMVFLIYLKFQFKGTDLASKDEAGMVKALIYWAKQQTADYDNVRIDNLTSHWRDGLAFNAILHKHHPDLIDYEEMKRRDPIDRLENAFKVAEGLGISQLMESEDVLRYGDKRSMFIYISSLYKHFSTMHNTVGQKRVRAAVRLAYNFVRDSNEYERKAGEFVRWMETQLNMFENTEHFKDCEYEELEQLKESHENYLEKEKKSRIGEELELFELYTLLLVRASACHLVPYQAPPGLIPQDIDFQFGELTVKEHSYRLKLLLRLQHLLELERLQRRFDKRANLLEDRLEKYSSELPAGPHKDQSTCNSQIKQLTSLVEYFATFEDRFTPLDNIISDLQKLDYKFIKQNIKRRDDLFSTFKKLKVIIDSKKWLFSVSLEFYKPDEEFRIISPRVNHIFDTLTLAKRQGNETDSLEEHPMFLITEIRRFEESAESNNSLILAKLHALEFIPESRELLAAYQTLLNQYKPLRAKISSAKELVLYFLNLERSQVEAVRMSPDLSTLMLTTTIREIELLERELGTVKCPVKHEDFQEFQDKIGQIRIKSLTLGNRVNVCLPGMDGREALDNRISALIEKCGNLERSSLETGWLWGLSHVLKDILELLRGVNVRVGEIEKREKDTQKLSAEELDTLILYKFETSILQESVNSILSGCQFTGEILPPCPDFSNNAHVKPTQQSITQILRRVQPAISQLLERHENRTRDAVVGSLQDLSPEAVRDWVKKLQGMADDMSFEAVDLDSLADQESKLRYLELSVGHLEENNISDGVPELKRSVLEKRNKKDSAQTRLIILSRIERARTYLQIKSEELENANVNPSLQTEKYYKSMHTEIEVFMDKLSDWFEGEIGGLDSESKFDCTILKNEFDSVCSDLLDRLSNLMKKSGEKEKSQKLVDETAAVFISWCESSDLDSQVDLSLLSEDPPPTEKLNDFVTDQNFAESEFAKNKPVYEKLINDLYHSGFANGREKGKEVQKRWQVLEQTMSENSKKTGFVANCLAFQTEFDPLMNLVDRLNSEEIPAVESEFSPSPSFEETQNLSVKIGTLVNLAAFIADMILTKSQLKKLVRDSTELIGAEEANRFFAPKMAKLENGIEKATTDLGNLNQLVKCWVNFYVLDRRSTQERTWARNGIEDAQANSLNEHRIVDLTNWANNLKQNWIQENIAPKQYQNYPEDLRSRIVSSLNETNRTLDELLLRVSQHKEMVEDSINSENKLGSVQAFEEKLNSLEDTSETFQGSEDLVDTARKMSEINGILHLLTKLRDEIQARDPESKTVEKIPTLMNLYEDLISNLKSRQHSFNVCIDLQTHIERMSEGIEYIENLPPSETLDFEQLMRTYFQIGLRKILCLSCKKFLDEIDVNPLESKDGIEFEDSLSKLRELYEKLNQLIEFHENQHPIQEENMIAQTKLDEAMEYLGDTEFILSNGPDLSELSCLESIPPSIQNYVSSCNENPEFQARCDEINEKSGNVGDQIQTQKEAEKLEKVDGVTFLDLVEFFKKWLEPILEEFLTVSNEKLPKYGTIPVQDYFKFILTETAPKLYSVLQEECPRDFSLSEKLEGVWPIEQDFIDENTAKLEFSWNSRLFLLFVEVSTSSIGKMMRERIPNPDSFKGDIPLAKISPDLCNACLKVAGSLYSTSSEKYRSLTAGEVPSENSAQFKASMQSLSQAYGGLVERCKQVVAEARAAVIRDPIVKKVRQLGRSQSQLEEALQLVCEEEDPPHVSGSEKELEARLSSQESACKELPGILAASRDPDNSLPPADIQEVQEHAVQVAQSLDDTKDTWNQTKVMFSRKEMLKMLRVKEEDLEAKVGKIDEVDRETTLDAWELWADSWIDKLSKLEISEAETTTTPSLSHSLSLESSFTESEYSISDFTTANPASFELTSLDLSSQFEYFNINPPESITETLETSTQSVRSVEGDSLGAAQYTLDLESEETSSPKADVGNENSLDSLDTALQSRMDWNSSDQISQDLEFEFKSALTPLSQIKSQPLVEKIDEKVELKVLERDPNTFDFTNLAFDVVSQESIDGDPARPSPVHRLLDVRDSEDGEDFARNIIEIMMSSDESYVQRGSEYEGKAPVQEVVELKEQPLVQAGFDFDRLFEDTGSTPDPTEILSRDTSESEGQARMGKNGTRKRRHVSFTREDVVISVKTQPIPKYDVLVSGKKLLMQGSLRRKLELLAEGRKPIKRPWKDMFIAVKPGRLEFYKDQIEMAVGNSLSPEHSLSGAVALSGAVCEVPSDYTKKDFVFRIKCANGSSYLFQTSDSNSLSNWLTAINQSIILSDQQTEGNSLVRGPQPADPGQSRGGQEVDADVLLEGDTEEAKGKSKLPKFFGKK